MIIDKLFNILKCNEKYIFKNSRFLLFNQGDNIWEITTDSTCGEIEYIIEKTNNGFTIKEVNRSNTYLVFENLSEDDIVYCFPFYIIKHWGEFYTLPDYNTISNNLSFEEAVTSLKNDLKELKYCYFNTPKGANIKRIDENQFAFEIKINDKVETEIDTIDIIAKTVYFISLSIHDFYSIFYQMGIESKYEEDCKKFYLFDDLFDIPLIDFFRSQKN